jgi:acetylornithine deacetylase
VSTVETTPLSAVEQRVLALVDAVALVDDLRQLVALPSVGGSAAEAAVQRWCAARLEELGLSVDAWTIDLAEERAEDRFPGMEVERTEAIGCVGVLGGPSDPAPGDSSRRPALALCGHTDVVPPGNPARWAGGDPWALRVEDGIAFGRGACDMKGGLAAVLAAVAAISRAGVRLRRPLAVHCVAAEEDGGVGAFATLRRGHLADACVIAEPTAGAVIPANAGAMTFRLDVPGLATHGSTRSRGVSAVELLAPLLAALRELEADRHASVPDAFAHLDLAWPISVGVVRAGHWASTVPDHLVAEGRMGVRPDESVAAAQQALEQAVAACGQRDPWLREHPVEVTWPGGRFAPGALPAGHPLLAEVLAAVSDAAGGPTAPVRGAPYGSDLRHYAAAGVPALQYGPGDVVHAHAVDEQVAVADLVRCARAYALLALRRCGTAD